MIARFVALGAVAALLCAAPGARAEAPAESQADALFTEGKHLRDAGRFSEACTKFAQSQQLSPGVGIALHLGDCYERIGRTASAWQEFRAAEKLAREHNDAKREELARTRAETVEPKINRLRIDVPPGAAAAGAELHVDGAGIPRVAWDAPLAIDPGDHVVAFAMPGQAARTVTAHVEAAAPIAVVQLAEPAAPAAPAPVPAAEPAAPAQPQLAPEAPADGGRRWVEYGLAGAGLVGIGVGAALLASNSQSPAAGSGCATPPPDSGPTTGAIIAFGAGGAALAAAFVVFFTGPHAKGASMESAIVVTPAPVPGGGGALLRASF